MEGAGWGLSAVISLLALLTLDIIPALGRSTVLPLLAQLLTLFQGAILPVLSFLPELFFLLRGHILPALFKLLLSFLGQILIPLPGFTQLLALFRGKVFVAFEPLTDTGLLRGIHGLPALHLLPRPFSLIRAHLQPA